MNIYTSETEYLKTEVQRLSALVRAQQITIDKLEAQSEQKRPQNCGTGYCSCIECVMGPEQEPVAWAKEYSSIQDFYRQQTAKRSRLPLMRHIDDGLHILQLIEASDLAKAAFCLHPIVQNSESVDVAWSDAYQLACEYRDKANAYLCRPDTDWVTTSKDVRSIVGDMSEDCRAMLIADKRQNYGDFIAAHFGKHARSEQLDRYFRLWLSFLEGTSPPPQRGPLTDEEINDIAKNYALNNPTTPLHFARAIEAAHGIKENT